VSVLIAASAAVTCLGDESATVDALLAGRCGIGDLRYFPATALNVRRGYQISEPGAERPLRASAWLTECVARAVARAAARAGLDTTGRRVVACVGTGLRELRAVERGLLDGVPVRVEELHFAGAVRAAAPGVEAALTISNACSAGGYALALGQDLLEQGEADAVIVAGTDAMTESMLAMIGRFAEEPTDRVRPFDVDRTGVLLGEGAAALVLVGEGGCARPEARLLGTGLSCDAWHETAPDPSGICRAVTDALLRAGRTADQVDVVFAHGTGTDLNDSTEAAVLREVFPPGRAAPLVTGLKGAVGHTSGASALTSLVVAVRCLGRGAVPPVVGLRRPLPEGAGLNFVTGTPHRAALRLAQVNAFGFGGVNAVSLVEAV
jgi:3-oxoacyl-[acyl-carrier-protein] synthase II